MKDAENRKSHLLSVTIAAPVVDRWGTGSLFVGTALWTVLCLISDRDWWDLCGRCTEWLRFQRLP